MGYLSIRQKTVKQPVPLWEHCDKFATAVQQLVKYNASCPANYLDSSSEQKDVYTEIQAIYDANRELQKNSDFIRGPAKPYLHVSAEDNSNNHQIGIIHGELQSYDAGGYSAEYKLDGVPANL